MSKKYFGIVREILVTGETASLVLLKFKLEKRGEEDYNKEIPSYHQNTATSKIFSIL